MPPTRSAPSPAPAGLALYRLAIGHYVSRALAVATKLGVAERLADGPLPVEALAEQCASHGPSLRRVLRLLASVGVFSEGEDGRFALNPLGDLLRDDAPGSMAPMVRLFAGDVVSDSWRDLEHSVRTGEPAFMKDDPSATPFTVMEKNPEAAANFDRAMATFAPETAAGVTAAYDFSGFARLLDVGGGNGALLAGILAVHPSLRGVVFDQPHVAERARRHVEASGLADRIEVIGGSFFEAVPSGADAILLKHVIHDWDDERAAAILVRCREALAPRGRVLVVEGVYPERIEATPACLGAAANDVNMLVCTGGRQRSEREFRALYRASGLRLSRIVPTPARVAVIEGVPA